MMSGTQKPCGATDASNGRTNERKIGAMRLSYRFRGVFAAFAAFGPAPCRAPADTGYHVRATTGHYQLNGECEPVTLNTGEDGHSLDPARLTAAEWEVVRPTTNSANYRFQITRRVTPLPQFILQQWVPPAEPSGTGAWRDITGSVLGLQAGVKLREKPVALLTGN